MKSFVSLWILVLIASAFAALVPKKNAREPASAVIGANRDFSPGPFIVSSPQSRAELPADRAIPVEVHIQFQVESRDVIARVRGVDGVQVLSASQERFGAAGLGKDLLVPVTVRLPRGTRGLLAVDVSYQIGVEAHRETRALDLQEAPARGN